MGKFRDSLVGLSTSVANCEGAVKQIEDKLTKTATNVSHHFTVVMEGYQATYMHLNELAKKKGGKVEDLLGKTLAEVGDKDLPAFVKGINDAIAAGVKDTQSWTQLHKTNVEPAQKLTVGLDEKLDQLNAMLAKKKKKLIQSAKYKTKLAGYESALKALGDVAKKLRLAVTSINPPQNEEQFKKYGLKPTDKVQLIKDRAGFLPNQIKAFEQQGKDSVTHARNAKTFNLSGQMKAVQSMIADAEGMEKEAPEL